MYRKRHTEAVIRHYFFQLTEGCRKEGCENNDCATGSGQPLTHDQAAAKALELARSRGKGGLCVPFERSASKSSSTVSLTNDKISKTPSSTSTASSVTEESRPEHRTIVSQTTPEPMETTDNSERVVPTASSTESMSSSSPLILIHSRASTGDTPPVSRRHMPDPSGISASSSSESGISGPTGLTTTTSASVEFVSLSRSTDDTTTSSEDTLPSISMDTSSSVSSSDVHTSKIKSSVRHLTASDAYFDPIGKSPLVQLEAKVSISLWHDSL